MILVQANHLARYFGATRLYEDVSFTIRSRDRIALVGRNGTGKSTLIKQILGSEPITKGSVSIGRQVRIGHLDQHVSVDSNKTIWEESLEVFSETLAMRDRAERAAQAVADFADQPDSDDYQEALRSFDYLTEELDRRNAYGIEAEIRTVLHGFRFYEEDYDTPVQSLSGGQKTRLALAQLLLKDYDLLILDEPTNHLDMQMLTWLETFLNNYRGALLVVSHDRYFLDKIATQVLEIRHGTGHLYKGNYSDFVKEKAQRLTQEMKAYQAQQEKIASLEDFIQRNIVHASTSGQAKSRRKQLERMQKLEKPLQDPKAPRIQFRADKDSGDRVIEAIGLGIGYANQVLAQPINFDLRRQEAIAIVGPNGIGKTTLLRTILGEIPKLAGEILFGSNVSIGYYDQNVNHLDPKESVLETLWKAHDTTDEGQIRSILGSFLFSGEDVDKSVGMLSGGEKARLALALLASEHDNTLLLDEPTNHLDIDSKEVLEDALINYNGTLLFVSHDRYFINRIATAVLEIHPEGSDLYLGDYDYYLAKKAELQAIEAAGSEEVPEVIPDQDPSNDEMSYQERQQLQRDLRQLKRSTEHYEGELMAIEERIESLEAAMEAVTDDPDQSKLIELHQDFSQAQDQQLQILEAWEKAATELEDFYATYPEFE